MLGIAGALAACNPVGESAVEGGTLGGVSTVSTGCTGALVTANAVGNMPVSNCFVSRASTAKYFDSAGVVQTAAINTLRVNYDPVTLLFSGFLVEPAATNVITNSVALSTGATWVVNGTPTFGTTTTAPDGGAAFVFTSAQSFSGVYKPTTVTSGVVYTFSAFVKHISGNPTVRIGVNGSVFEFNASTGVSASQSGFAGAASCSAVANGWFRCQAPFLTTAVTHNPYMYNRLVAASENAFWGPQFEVGTSATSYITSTAGATTRAADIYRLP